MQTLQCHGIVLTDILKNHGIGLQFVRIRFIAVGLGQEGVFKSLSPPLKKCGLSAEVFEGGYSYKSKVGLEVPPVPPVPLGGLKETRSGCPTAASVPALRKKRPMWSWWSKEAIKRDSNPSNSKGCSKGSSKDKNRVAEVHGAGRGKKDGYSKKGKHNSYRGSNLQGSICSPGSPGQSRRK